MSYDQPDLFTKQAETIDELPKPKLNYEEANLGFRQSKEQVRHGLGSFDDSEPRYHIVTSCVLPAASGIRQTVVEYGHKIERPYTLYGRAEHKDAGELINWWLEQKNYIGGDSSVLNKDTDAGKWILAHAKELNEARRYWAAYRTAQHVRWIEQQIKDFQEQLRVKKIDASVTVREAAEGRIFSPDERKLLMKEFGALDRDLAS